MNLTRTILACLAVSVLTACATSRVVIDHANNGVALTAGLQRELSTYDAQQKTIDKLRRQVIIDETLEAKRYLRDNELEDVNASLIGDRGRFSIYTQMRQAAEARAKLHTENTSDEKEVQNAMDTLMKLAAPPLTKIATTQKALADLGEELSFSERFKLAAKFTKDMRDEVKKAKTTSQAAVSK